MTSAVRVQLGEDGADAERVEQLTGYLRADQDRLVSLFVSRHVKS